MTGAAPHDAIKTTMHKQEKECIVVKFNDMEIRASWTPTEGYDVLQSYLAKRQLGRL